MTTLKTMLTLTPTQVHEISNLMANLYVAGYGEGKSEERQNDKDVDEYRQYAQKAAERLKELGLPVAYHQVYAQDFRAG